MSHEALIRVARRLSRTVEKMPFDGAVAHIYNPLRYAWPVHEQYLRRFGASPKRVLMLGMNPGPFGMMQTGVPFGEVAAVRDWMHLQGKVSAPADSHPKRPIQGFDCTRSEVSGRRLWGWAAERFGSPEAFFSQTFVLNYCPLVFLEQSGRNLTPDKLPAHQLAALQAACDQHLQSVIDIFQPVWAIGVGAYAAKRLQQVTGAAIEKDGTATGKQTRASAGQKSSGATTSIRVGQILHPSPASPLANRGWAQAAQATLDELGVYPD